MGMMTVIGPRRTVVAVALLAMVLGSCGGASNGAACPPPHNPPPKSAGTPSKGAYAAGAALVADSSFRPDAHGLPFENYGKVLPDGSTPTNMTAEDVRAMFGDRVCADAKAGKCDLVPEAQVWLDSTNKEMAGGPPIGFSPDAPGP